MLLNYLKTIYRDLIHNKLYTFISIFGLAVGISASLVLVTLVMSLLSQDKFHEKGDRICQAFSRTNYNQAGEEISSTMSVLLGDALVSEIPEIVNSVTITSTNAEKAFIVGDKKFHEKGIWANPSLFTIFSFPVIAKTTDSIFNDLNSISISESLAKKYFGAIDSSLGQAITLRSNFDKREAYVSSVFKDVPFNSTLKFDYVMPIEFFLNKNQGLGWGNRFSRVFIELEQNINVDVLNNKIKDFIKDHTDWLQSELFLHKYENIFLDNPYGGTSYESRIKILLSIGLGILFMASINFINLSISRTTKKAKEVGLRKVVGAGKRSLIFRFIGESVIITFLAMFLAICFTEIIVPYINQSFLDYVNLKIVIPYSNLYFYFSLIVILAVVSLISGLYPAFFLSSFSPISVLKGKSLLGKNPIFMRKALVVIQFIFSGLFIIVTIASSKQLNLIKNKDLGVNIEQVLSFSFTNKVEKHFSAFRHDLKLNSQVKGFTSTDFQPTGVYSSTSDPYWEGKPEKLNDMFPTLHVSDGFIKTFNIDIINGRDFEEGDSVDISNFIINEKMASIIGKDNPVGLKLSFWGEEGQIIGVVKNFHIGDLMTEIRPLIIIKNPMRTFLAWVRFDSETLPEVINHLKRTYAKYENEFPLSYSFLKEDFVKMHGGVIMSSRFNVLFATIAIIISCLGLIGLTALTAEQKTKEIGIRKVLGAPIASILFLLSKGLMQLVILSFIISAPISYYVVNDFLDDFAFKIEIGIDIFLYSFFLLLTISLAAILVQGIRASLANPVEALKYE